MTISRRKFIGGMVGGSLAWPLARRCSGGSQVDSIAFEHILPKGVQFTTNSSRTQRKHQPETMVSGVALFDYNNDGFLDIYAVNGATMPSLVKTTPDYYNRLFRNNGDGTFEDVTIKAGVQGGGYNHGVAIGDYDNDGYEDIFVAGLKGNILYHNNGDGTFTDVTAKAGLNRPDPQYGTLWAVCAAWVDYDRDGWLDLFVSNYCVWDSVTEPRCVLDGVPDYCSPLEYKGLPNSLFHNNRDGTFTDVSVESGIRKHIGKGMGVAIADLDGDGWPDIVVANDTLPNFIFINQKDGTFKETSVESGVAYTANGIPVSGMGMDARDIDNDGMPDIFETALPDETFPLFRNLGKNLFDEITYSSGLAQTSRDKAGWSNGIYDFDNDGWKDLFVACGQVMDPRGKYGERVKETNAVFMNLRNGTFADVSSAAGLALGPRAVHRGTAFGDLNNDGRIDVVVTALDASIEVWKNVSSPHNHWILIKTEGTKSNRDGIGAKIKVVTESGSQYNHVTTSVGYGCSSDRRVHFGLGKDKVIKSLEISWPSGAVQRLTNIAADQILTVKEP